MQTIPLTAREPRAFTPPSLEARYEASLPKKPKKGKKLPPKPQFYIAVPTLAERETIGSIMFELGVIQVSRETTRNATLEAAIEMYGEDEALWLESHWQQTDLWEGLLDIWEEQERQRLLDNLANPKKAEKEPAPKPEPLTTLKDRLKAKRLVDEIIAKDAPLRTLLARQTRYGREYEIMSMRVHLRGWQGLETQREAASGDNAPEIVTEDCIMALREEVGQHAWRELFREIDDQYGLSAEEVGNSDSPPESGLPPTGSTPTPPKESGDSHGTSTEQKSSSEPAPEAE